MDDNWLVKEGVWEKLTDAVVADEHEAVKANRFADALKPVFEIGKIDFGRADHASAGGRTVVFEINTNPYIGPYVPDPKPLRRATQAVARQRFAAALNSIDTTGKGTITLRRTRFFEAPLAQNLAGSDGSWAGFHLGAPDANHRSRGRRALKQLGDFS